MTIILPVLDRFKNFFHWKIFLDKFAVKRISKIPPHPAYIGVLKFVSEIRVGINSPFSGGNGISLSGGRHYRAMLCIRGTSHGPVSVSVCLSVCHKSEFYYNG